MKVSVIRGVDLTVEHVEAWSAFQTTNSALESPFFRPEFTRAVAQDDENVYVGILHQPSGGIAGFFPFRSVRPGYGTSLEMCDYQGVIAKPEFQFGATELVRGCGLKVWEFDHLLSTQQAFRNFHTYEADSPIINLEIGYDAYIENLNETGKKQLAKIATSTRKVERELGALRFVQDCHDVGVMAKMHEWRALKYGALPQRSHKALEIIRQTNTDEFGGVLSALYAGDQLIAVHFGIRSRTVWHWWFPAYNPELPSRYAPGLLLLLNMAQTNSRLGTRMIDLGKGKQDYKDKFRNDSLTVATGSVDVISLSNVPRIVRRQCANFVRNTPSLLNLARTAKRVMGRK